MEHNAVIWFEIYVQDMERARKFYETVLDVKLVKLTTPTPDLEMWAFPHKSGAVGASGVLAKMKGVPSASGGTMVYFASADCAREEARVEKAGGKICRGKFSIAPHGFITIIQDTEGNTVGVHSMA